MQVISWIWNAYSNGTIMRSEHHSWSVFFTKLESLLIQIKLHTLLIQTKLDTLLIWTELNSFLISIKLTCPIWTWTFNTVCIILLYKICWRISMFFFFVWWSQWHQQALTLSLFEGKWIYSAQKYKKISSKTKIKGNCNFLNNK